MQWRNGWSPVVTNSMESSGGPIPDSAISRPVMAPTAVALAGVVRMPAHSATARAAVGRPSVLAAIERRSDSILRHRRLDSRRTRCRGCVARRRSSGGSGRVASTRGTPSSSTRHRSRDRNRSADRFPHSWHRHPQAASSHRSWAPWRHATVACRPIAPPSATTGGMSSGESNGGSILCSVIVSYSQTCPQVGDSWYKSSYLYQHCYASCPVLSSVTEASRSAHIPLPACGIRDITPASRLPR